MSTPDVKLQAVLRSACPPSEEQRSRLTAFLEKKYQQSVELSWSEDKSILGGFRIELGTEVIDWTTGGRLDQLKEKLASISAGGQDVIPLIRDTVKSWVPEVLAYEVGTVLRVATVSHTSAGLEHRLLPRDTALRGRHPRHGTGSEGRPYRLHPFRRL